jgi:hypothetical protein
MKTLKSIFLLCSLFIITSAFHKYFFAFAEMEYKTSDKRLETTLIFTMHDLEASLIKKSVIKDEFERVKHDSLQLKKIETAILKDFTVSSNSSQIEFKLLDFKLTKNGLINLFLEASNVELDNEVDIKFTNLMSDYPNQQNKITFIFNGKKNTAVFLKNKPTQKIIL